MVDDGSAAPQGGTNDDDKGKPQGEPKNDDKPQGGSQSKPQGDDDGTDWKSLARKWENQANADKKARDKATADLEAVKNLLAGKDQATVDAEKKAEKAELESAKYRIAYEAGLPPDLAKRLSGDSEAELKADAEALAEYTKSKKRPKSDTKAGNGGGDNGGDGGPKGNANDLLRQAFGRG